METKETEDAQVTEERLVAKGWPPSLAKATVDPFHYALKLKDGTVLEFEEAEEIEKGDGTWVTIKFASPGVVIRGVKYTLERGMDIRLSEIDWCIDAPHGS